MDLNKILQVELYFKIVSFFYENPSSLDTVKGIATWVNHKPGEVEEALEKLVELNILVVHRSEAISGFAYTQDKEISRSIDNYFKNRLNNQVE